MKNVVKFLAFAAAMVPAFAFAEGEAAHAAGGSVMIPLGIGITMGLAALGGTLGQGKAISSALDSIGRNPSASGKVFTPMLVGLAFVESLVILSFAIAYLLLAKV